MDTVPGENALVNSKNSGIGCIMTCVCTVKVPKVTVAIFCSRLRKCAVFLRTKNQCRFAVAYAVINKLHKCQKGTKLGKKVSWMQCNGFFLLFVITAEMSRNAHFCVS